MKRRGLRASRRDASKTRMVDINVDVEVDVWS